MLESLIAPVTGLLDKFIPDADERNRLAHEIATMSERHAHELAKGQIEINKTEAAHQSMFVAGWRPCLGLAFLGPTLDCVCYCIRRNRNPAPSCV